jgi:hypothetical protein
MAFIACPLSTDDGRPAAARGPPEAECPLHKPSLQAEGRKRVVSDRGASNPTISGGRGWKIKDLEIGVRHQFFVG